MRSSFSGRVVVAIVASVWLPVAALAPRLAWAIEPREEALGLSKQALDAYLSGDFESAAILYLQAYKQWPSETLYLYNAARAAERAGRVADAERMYLQYLDRAPPKQQEVAKARFHLAEMQAVHKSAAPPVERKPAPARGSGGPSRAAVGTGVLVAGGAVAAAGGIVLALAHSDQVALDVRKSQVGPDGKIIGIGVDELTVKQNGVNTNIYLGWTLVGVGVAAGITGAVLLATAPDSKVAVVPWSGGRGVEVAWRF